MSILQLSIFSASLGFAHTRCLKDAIKHRKLTALTRRDGWS
jgi:hypothetical protein